MFALIFCAVVVLSSIYPMQALLHGNETEVLAFQALQAYASMPELHALLAAEVKKSVRVNAIPNLFAQQNGIFPPDGEYQLPNFGALVPWNQIMKKLNEDKKHRLIIMIRHGQAWENLNPTSNANCDFIFDGETIPNFDSPLTPFGTEQAQSLNQLLQTPVTNTSRMTWFETIGLTHPSTVFLTSPLSRTMQTTQHVFQSLLTQTAVQSKQPFFQVSELIRATIGRDVCNVRKSAISKTDMSPLPAPWQSGCSNIPSDSLQETFVNENKDVPFMVKVRPPGGGGFGLISDEDSLWRSDIADDEIQSTRVLAFLAQVYENTADSAVVVMVTHGEIVRAMYEAVGEIAYTPKNTEVVPLLLKF